MKIDNIQFHPHVCCGPGLRGVVFFENGYGASVIHGCGFHCSPDKPYEIAVLEGNEDGFCVVYTHEIDFEELTYLTEKKANKILKRIKELPLANK